MAQRANELTALSRLFERCGESFVGTLQDPAQAYMRLRTSDAIAATFDPLGTWNRRGYRVARPLEGSQRRWGISLFAKRTPEYILARHVDRVVKAELALPKVRAAEEQQFIFSLRASVLRLGEFAC